ncbi:MAG: alkaline phosphatase D family protein [Planctomycetaceae bacterium]|jgi:alkaline phosphatase D|nr:alkaline phosphatase D family protein [Planctomycetaceae bacterium]
MTIRLIIIVSLSLCPTICNAGDSLVVKSINDFDGLPSRIAFGSCSKQFKPQPILNEVVDKKPDLFIYLGDNIYADTYDMKVLRDKYQELGSKPEFQALREKVTVLSVWDDHDYGANDAGNEYPKKVESREIFFDFWQVPKNSPRRTHPGIYGSHEFAANGKRLQIILLDTRYFRDSLKRRDKNQSADLSWKNDYQPDPDPQKTLLGAEQWKWLEQEFRKPADLRIVCSSIQFGHSYNGWESWTNLPNEQQRMFDLIKSTKANGVVFISGDVHWAEINKRQPKGHYPIYDITASGLTEEWHNVEPSTFRVGEAYRDNHFGMFEIDWMANKPSVTFNIIGLDGTIKRQHATTLDALTFTK